MNKATGPDYIYRDVTIVDLPLPFNAPLLKPQDVMVRVAGRVHDIGSHCFTVRSSKNRKSGCPTGVVLQSLSRERIPQIRAVIRSFSNFLTDGGLRPDTIDNYCACFRDFMRWADATGHLDCLAGGDKTRTAYRAYASDVEDRYRRHDFGSTNGFHKQKFVLTTLAAVTGLEDLAKGIRLIRFNSKEVNSTEPVNNHDFAHALALNAALFRGLSDLVLDNKPFPYKVALPESLGWSESCLWVFPTSAWMKPGPVEESKSAEQKRNRVYDYKNGCLASVDDIWRFYKYGSEKSQRHCAQRVLDKAQANLDAANSDARAYYRLQLAHIAQNAFFFLFMANTGGNLQTVIDIETDGTIGEEAVNQGYRSIKWRAGGKEVDLVVPVAFMQSLRRFMELRTYLLDGEACQHLFFTLGKYRKDPPKKIDGSVLQNAYAVSRRVDPSLPMIAARKIRATVSNYYQQQRDASIVAAVLQNTEATALKSYNAGTEVDQHVEISLVMQKIAQKAQTQVLGLSDISKTGRRLEDGGICPTYGNPQTLPNDSHIIPNCKTGCLFCANRVLVAGEEDTRKVASAAFLMERLIMGPLSEAEYRPQIEKCDDDLAKLRAFEDCAEMVDRVKDDVYVNGNLTPYFAEKYQLFLSLGVL